MGWCGLSAAATVVAVLWWMSDQGLSVLDLALLGIALVSVAETLVWDITRRIVGRRLDVVQSTPQER